MRKILPDNGRNWNDIETEMHSFAKDDVDWRHGRHAFHVWYGGDDVFAIQKKAYTMFMQENGGGAGKTFKSLKHMEDGVIDFAAQILNGPEAVGHITSGGSESIFVAMKAARDWARKNRSHIAYPEVIIPFSGHPTFNRAGEYLGLRITRIPVRNDFRADIPAMVKAISKDTVAIVGSAVCFPYGVVDPIEDLATVARERGLWLHVDACVSGYSAPFCRELGYRIPNFDFAIPGVTSISADLHKYGFCAKGTSTALYRSAEFEKYQPFDFYDWPLGHFSNPNVASTRPGGSIAAAWAVMNFLGHDGYLRLNQRLMRVRERYMAGIDAISGLHINGEPHSLIITFSADDPSDIEMANVADIMLERGWFLGRLEQPPGILIGLSLPHEAACDSFLQHLEDAVKAVRKGEKRTKKARVVY
jgi:sphinganine-1-phosphate aldolase